VVQIKPFFVKIAFSQPTDGQVLTSADFPFTVKGTAIPQEPATMVSIGGWDTDDDLVNLMLLLGTDFSFDIPDPGTLGPHLITVFAFDDTGELTENSVSYQRA
jgi:hypothetical protein